MATKSNRFDIDLAFNIHPMTKDLVVKRSENAIRQSLKNIVLTSCYDRGFNVEYGANIYNQLFEADGLVTAKSIQTDIINAIANFEPDVELTTEPSVEIEDNTLSVNIYYVIFNSTETQTLSIEMSRVR